MPIRCSIVLRNNRRKRKTKVGNEPVKVHKQSVGKVSVATMTNSEDFPSNAHQDSPELSSVAKMLGTSAQDKQADDGNSQASTPQQVEENKVVNLQSCSNIHYDKRDGVHGVTYRTEDGDEGWTPVRRKRVKKAVPLHLVHRRAPPHVRATLQSSSDDSESASDSDSSSTNLTIPDHAAVNYSIVDGKPGLQVNTRNIRNWTPIAACTRAKLKS